MNTSSLWHTLAVRTLLCSLGTLALVTTLMAPVSAVPGTCRAEQPVYGHRPAPVKSQPRAYRHANTWVYGDSITWQTRKHLRRVLPGREAMDAWYGRNTRSAVIALANDARRYRLHLPAVVVVATGTNDLGDLAEFSREVHRARQVLPRRVVLVWVNVYVETTPAWNAANRVLSGVPGLRVASWSWANVARARNSARGLLVDGVHVNDAGCAVRDRLIRRAVVSARGGQ